MGRWVPMGLLVFFCVFLLSQSVQSEPELKLVHAFRELQVTPEQYVLHHGGNVHSYDLEQFMHSFQKKFFLSQIVKKVNREGIIYRYWGRIHHLDMEVTCFCSGGSATSESYVSVQVMGKGAFDKELINLKKQLTSLLRINRLQPDFHFSIQGYRRGTDQKKTLREALRLMRAEEVESMQTKTLSVSAYSPLFQNRVKTSLGEMNVQIATRVNQKAEKVLVTMGIPIITIEY